MKSTDFHDLALEAYIFGYPLITMEFTRRVMTNVERPNGLRAPMNQIGHARKYPSSDFRDVTAPNADTLYSFAWLDLSKEPFLLELPDPEGRYFMFPLLDAWSNVFESIGTRTTGNRGGKFVIVGPDWSGALPGDSKAIHAPTNLIWIIGRIYCEGTPTDYGKVHAFQDRISLVPLSEADSQYSPPVNKIDKSVDMKTPVRDQVHQLDALHYFRLLSDLIRKNPPARADRPFIEKMRAKGFTLDQFEPSERELLKEIPADGQRKITDSYSEIGTHKNGWDWPEKTGIYGTDYLMRAVVTEFGLGANLREDAIYPTSRVDIDGEPLDGSRRYLLHFDKGRLPPVKGFWSLTMYDSDYFFVANPLDRHTVSSRSKFRFNGDGSLDVFVQKDSPGAENQENWLPAPTGPFILILRLYWPEESLMNETWDAPAIRREKNAAEKKAG